MLQNDLNNYLAIILFGLAFTFSLRAFTEKKSLKVAWFSLGVAQLNISIAMFLQGIDLYFLSMFVGGMLLELSLDLIITF